MSKKAVTSCKDCVFAEKNEDSTQVGCELERSDKLGVGSVNEGNYVLERFCNTYRPDDWLQDLSFDEAINTEGAVLKEVYPRVGFFIKLDTNVEDAISELDKTVKSIAENNNPAYVVAITEKVEYNQEIWGLFLRHFGDSGPTKFHIVQLSGEFAILDRIVDEAFTHAQNGWIHITKAGTEVPSVGDRIQKIVNKDMVQLMAVEPYEDIYGMTFQALLFKFLNGNKTKVFHDATKMSGTFMDKVRASQERTNSKCLYTWEEFLNEPS